MSNLIDRNYILKIIEMWMKVPSYSESELNIMRAIDYEVRTAPSESSWSAIKDMLNELEQNEERLYSDYCDTTARLRAINKIAKSSQKPNQKIDGIKPLTELDVGE